MGRWTDDTWMLENLLSADKMALVFDSENQKNSGSGSYLK